MDTHSQELLAGTERRGKGFPYIVHPMEAVAIVSTMTSDQELLAAAALHDTVEDTDVTVEDLRKEFGNRIAALVADESDEPFILETFHMPKALSIRFWQEFAPAYFGAGCSMKDIEEEIGPYAGLKTIIIERDTRRPMPEFREQLRSVL